MLNVSHHVAFLFLSSTVCENWDRTLERVKCHFQAWGSAEAGFGQVALALYPEDGVERVLWVQTQLVLRGCCTSV